MWADIIHRTSPGMLPADARQKLALVVDDRQTRAEVRVVPIGPRCRPKFTDIADRTAAIRHEHAARPVQIVELRLIATVAIEHLDTVVLPIRDINPAIRIA